MVCMAHGSGLGAALVLAVFTHCVSAVASPRRVGKPQKFLLVSAPRDGKVAYAKLGGFGARGASSMQNLITSGLVHPQGLAVDAARHTLLVADPDAGRIIAFRLMAQKGRLKVGPPVVCAEDVESRWVAVDSAGNVFFSDEPRNRILKLPGCSAAQIFGKNASNLTAASQLIKSPEVEKPVVLYAATGLAAVSAPGGVATDGFHTYWVNKRLGTQAGSLMRGAGSPNAARTFDSVETLANNVDKSYGVCMTANHVFYTEAERAIYGVSKRSGSPATVISNRLQHPRGCAWDGDGTVYVADRGADAVYSFAANMREQDLAPRYITKAADFDDAFGVAVYAYSAAMRLHAAALAALLAAAVAFCTSTN